MGSLDGITAQSRTAKIGHDEIRVAPLTVADYGEYLAWAQDQYLSLVQRTLAGLPAEMRSDEYRAAVRTAAAFGIGTAPKPPLGDHRLLWMAVRRNHPDITFEKLLDMLSDPTARKALFDAFGLANSTGESEDDDPKAAGATT